MESFLLRWINQIKEFYQTLSGGKKLILWSSLVFIVVFIIFISKFAVDTTYSVLYSNLDLEDASLITEKLKDKKIPFNFDPKTGTISIAPEFIHETRLLLATEGLPGSSSVVGFEVFDKSTFGMNSYVQRINYVRAKEGELTRTLSRLDGVERARVHITIPEKKTFIEDQKPAKASIVLKLRHGKYLSKNQVIGIQHLVSSSIENLEKENVVVMDQSGKILTDPNDGSEFGFSNSQLEYKNKIERSYESQIVSMLERVVGKGKVEARVSADIDFSKQTMLIEDFDPDKVAVRSKVTNEKINQGSRPSPSGVPGARSNMPDADANPKIPEVKQNSSAVNETLNNEISKTVKNIVKGQGEINRLSVAVVLDGKYKEIVNEEGQVTGKEFVPLSKELLDKYRTMVSSAIGAKSGRDQVTIESMQFKDFNMQEDENALAMEKWNLIKSIIQYAVLAVLAMLFFIFFIRPFIKWVTDNVSDKPDELLPTTLEELETYDNFDQSLEGLDSSIPMLDEAIDPEKAETELLKEKIMSLIEGDPYKATQAVTEWLKKIEEEEKQEVEQAQDA